MKDPTLPPQNASEAVCRVLQLGLILIRSRPKDGQLIARVADYLHNLPDIMLHPTGEMLNFHWNIERRAYLREATEEEARFFAPFWEQLRPFVPNPVADEVALPAPAALRIAA